MKQKCIPGLALKDQRVERPSGCKKKNATKLLIMNEAAGRVSGQQGGQELYLSVLPQGLAFAALQPGSNCHFKWCKWSWHDKLRQNKSVGLSALNFQDAEMQSVPGRARW